MTTKGRHGEEGLVIGRQTMKPLYDFIDASREPFFIWYAPMMPHEPHTPPEQFLKKYQQEGRDARMAKYMAMCEWTDSTIGELLAYLEKQKLTENTLVLFVVDNGWIQTNGPIRKGEQFLTRSKNTAYDAGVRTPIIVKWPGKVKPGKYDDLVSTIDLAPTILEACGLKPTATMTGLSLLDVASGKGKLKRDAIFGEIYLHTAKKLDDPTVNLTHRWVRSGEWKLIETLGEKPETELYQISIDPAEKKNLARENQEQVARLQKLFKK
jgi:uncharacterized sulfatase